MQCINTLRMQEQLALKDHIHVIIYAYILENNFVVKFYDDANTNRIFKFYPYFKFLICFFPFLGPTGKTLSTKWFKIPGR